MMDESLVHSLTCSLFFLEDSHLSVSYQLGHVIVSPSIPSKDSLAKQKYLISATKVQPCPKEQ